MLSNTSVSFKDIITEIIRSVKYLFSKWLIIGIVAFCGAVLGIVYAFTATPKYSATLNFVLSDNSSSGSSLRGLANQFGLNLNNDNDNAFSGDNIITLMKSRRMVQEALFKKPGDSLSLINMYVKEKQLKKSWIANERTKNAFPFPDDPLKMTLIQDSLFRLVYNDVQKNILDVSKPDNNGNIYEVTTTFTNEVFSYCLTKYLVNATSAFYIDTKTSVAKQNLNMLLGEADSLRNVLGGAITSTGSFTDLTFNLNPAYQVQRSGAQQSQAKATALGQAYGQVLQNLEIAKISLLKETPLYQIIDEPTLPLNIDKPSKFVWLIIGGFLGVVFACAFLILKRLIKSVNINSSINNYE